MPEITHPWDAEQFVRRARRLGLYRDVDYFAHGVDLNLPGYLEFLKRGGTAAQWWKPLQDAWIAAIAARVVSQSSAGGGDIGGIRGLSDAAQFRDREEAPSPAEVLVDQ